jgi:uncharacterized repeat protein (TIGR03803 family)
MILRIEVFCHSSGISYAGVFTAFSRVVAVFALAALLTASAWSQATETVLYNFQSGSTGYSPGAGGLIFDKAGNLYGITGNGGAAGNGTVFELTPSGGAWVETVLHSFTGSDGSEPAATLIFDSAGNLYGTTMGGGATGNGTVFELTPSGGAWVETVLHSFTGSDGSEPAASLIFDSAGNLYGTTDYGGAFGHGTAFELSLSGKAWAETVLHSFSGGDDSDGSDPVASLIFDSAGNLYGTTQSGGLSCGAVFELTPSAGAWTETVLYRFDCGDGASPFGNVIFDSAGNLYGTTRYGGGNVCNYGYGCGTAFKLTHAGGVWTETVLHSFNGSDGDTPEAGLVFDKAGNLYGTTTGEGTNGYGNVFQLRPSGGAWTETVLYSFTGGADGGTPRAGLFFDSTGNLYGTAEMGGTAGDGVVFEIAGYSLISESVLYSFKGGSDGSNPSVGLIQDAAGNLYGTASGGGKGYGTVFKLSLSNGQWTQTVLYSFTGGNDGATPEAPLMFDKSGNLYGTTNGGGLYALGTVFEVSHNGSKWAETVLYSFKGGSDGNSPLAGVIRDSAGNLFGTTWGNDHNPNGSSTAFELRPNGNGGWSKTVLHNFLGGDDGINPQAGLILDNAGNLYGTTSVGGASDRGTVFELSPDESGNWTETVLHSFTGQGDGGYPQAELTIDSAGNLFGSTYYGGTYGSGTVFELSPSPGGVWTETVLDSFGNGNGFDPSGGVIFDAAGTLYGTTRNSGGTVFELTSSLADWTATTLHVFTGNPDGAFPQGFLLRDKEGNLYGTTYGGGIGCQPSGCGVVYEIINPRRTPTNTHVSSNQNPSVYGLSVTLTAKVSSTKGSGTPTGLVTFFDSGTALGVVALSGGIATLPISTFSAGLDTITASYSGDLNHSSSVSSALGQKVNQATSATVLVSSTNPSDVNQSVTLTATVTGQYGGMPTGSVTFQQGTTVLGTVPLVNSQTTLTQTFSKSGTIYIKATYSGDSNYKATASELPQIVGANQALYIGLPVLFVHGICDKPASFQVMESAVQAYLQGTYSQFYADPSQYWVFYDGENVNFEVPNGTTTYTSVPASARFFAVAFDDPGQSLIQDFDETSVAQISIYAKADELAHVIWTIKSITGAPRVIVISHSMGGLVSRAYVEELGVGTVPDSYFNDISTLVTLDTPHGGSLFAYLPGLDLSPCWTDRTKDLKEMQPSLPPSIIPQLNYVTGGASQLPVALTVYSIVSYWTIETPLILVDPLEVNTDNILTRSEQDLYSNLTNPSQHSDSDLFEVNNPFGALFGLCGTYPVDVLHSLLCTGSEEQTFTKIEKEIQIPSVMTQDVALKPSTATVAIGGNVQFVATTRSKATAIWSLLEGPDAGSISATGLYIPGSLKGQFHVVAIDSVKSNDYGIATVTVTQ